MTHFYEVFMCEYGGLLKNIPVPTILRETVEYRSKQDSLNTFIMQFIVVSPNAEKIGLPTLGTKYAEWYFEKFRRRPTSVESENGIESSRLAPHFQFYHGTLYLHGHRIKAMIEEPLGPDESEIIITR